MITDEDRKILQKVADLLGSQYGNWVSPEVEDRQACKELHERGLLILQDGRFTYPHYRISLFGEAALAETKD
ncbi:hypothetical protein LCGC14_1527500 [marine sediment metagenome]|uniref:Uncharacterized protein n=1 Tax=marine sediment metagenome TaxID=412755 RepID=A0A0F9IX80_9ZZZZ